MEVVASFVLRPLYSRRKGSPSGCDGEKWIPASTGNRISVEKSVASRCIDRHRIYVWIPQRFWYQFITYTKLWWLLFLVHLKLLSQLYGLHCVSWWNSCVWRNVKGVCKHIEKVVLAYHSFCLEAELRITTEIFGQGIVYSSQKFEAGTSLTLYFGQKNFK